MVQEILAYCILAVAVGVVVWRVVKRFRHKNAVCNEQRSGSCAGCPLSDCCDKATK